MTTGAGRSNRGAAGATSVSRVGRWLSNAAAMAGLMLASSTPAAAEIKSQSFALMPSATQAMMEFDIAQPLRLHAEASADVAQQRLVLIVKPTSPSGVNRISRAENAGRVMIDTDVTAQDLAAHGRRWVAIVAAAGQAPAAAVSGRIVVSDAAAPAAAAPPPAPRVGYVPPPPSTASSAPPPGGLLPPPRSGPPLPPSTASTPPPPPSTASAPPPQGYVPASSPSGRYRLSLLGASVNRKTTDDDNINPQVARRGDEVFFVVDMQELTPQGTSAPQRRKTPIYGAVASGNSATQQIAASMAGTSASERIRAGTMTVDGGLKAGDAVPYAQPWQRKAPNATDRLPLLVWEGTLTDGRNMLLVAPTVWELDDGGWMVGRYRNFSASAADMGRLMLGDLPPRAELFRAISDLARDRGVVVPLPELLNPQVLARFSSGTASPPAGATGGVTAAMAGMASSSTTDRPIGLAYQNGQPVFVPRVLVLNYATAERLVTPPKTPVPVLPSMFGPTTPMPTGTVLVQFRDDDRLGGEYVLFLQLERVQ